MSRHEQNNAAPNVCGQGQDAHNYGPCACCVALAQVRFPHYHHDASGTPYQFPYAAGSPAAQAPAGAGTCSSCGQASGGNGDGAGNNYAGQSDSLVPGAGKGGTGEGSAAPRKATSMSKFLSRYLSLTPGPRKSSRSGPPKRENAGSAPVSDNASAVEAGGSATGTAAKAENGSQAHVDDMDLLDSSQDDAVVKIPRPRLAHGMF